MKAILTLKNEDNTSTIIFEEIKDEKLFSCRNGEDEYTVDLREDFNIYMKSKDHTTKVSIKEKGDSNIRITDINGSILLPIDVLAIKENNGMISLVYKIDNIKNSINLEFIREV